MIKTEFGYRQNLELIKSMELSIEDLRRELLPHNPQWFELLAEGPREEIICLQAEADEYLSRQQEAA